MAEENCKLSSTAKNAELPFQALQEPKIVLEGGHHDKNHTNSYLTIEGTAEDQPFFRYLLVQ